LVSPLKLIYDKALLSIGRASARKDHFLWKNEIHVSAGMSAVKIFTPNA